MTTRQPQHWGGALLFWSWLAVGLLLAMGAQGFVPDADRVTGAVANANKSAGRAQALRFDLEMSIGDGDAIATGELVTHPTGLARLELKGEGGLVERHVLQGNARAASRNGLVLDRSRTFLPPLFLLQADSKVTMHAALQNFGVRTDAIGLAPCGESNCYVLGDPARVVPPRGQVRLATADSLGSFSTIWIDIETFDVLRMESPGGVKTTLGPATSVDGVSAPSWISIEEPGQSRVRFEVKRVTPVNAPAVAFGDSWLRAPVEP